MTLMRPLSRRHGADTGGATRGGGGKRDYFVSSLHI